MRRYIRKLFRETLDYYEAHGLSWVEIDFFDLPLLEQLYYRTKHRLFKRLLDEYLFIVSMAMEDKIVGIRIWWKEKRWDL